MPLTGAGSQPASLRASDADRERVIRLLRDCAVEGRLAHESFVRRIDLALGARDQRSLDDLVADLPGDRRSNVGTSLLSRGSAFVEQWLAATRRSRLPALTLPMAHQPVVSIGRGRDCDVVLADTTVSRVHARLRLFGDTWFLEDLGSTNGTHLNGVRLRAATPVRPGDRVRFGRPVFRIERSNRGV